MYKLFMFISIALFSQLSFAEWVTVNCKVNEVLTNDAGSSAVDRVHIRCANSVADGADNISYYALPINTSVKTSTSASNLINLGTVALTSGKLLSITFSSGDISGAVYGCRTGNCRKPVTISIR